MDLKNVEKLVRAILTNVPKTRDSDDVLYAYVIVNHNVDKNTTVYDFLYSRADEGIPPFETVRRTRQKIQADNPDLRGTRRMQKKRSEMEQKYKAYALKEN